MQKSTVRCWGSNARGHRCSGSTADSHVPVNLIGLLGSIRVAADGAHTCALLSGGTPVDHGPMAPGGDRMSPINRLLGMGSRWRSAIIIAALGAVVLVAGCGGGGQPATEQPRDSPTKALMLYRGGEIVSDSGIFALSPPYRLDDGGPVVLDGGHQMSFGDQIFLTDGGEAHTVITIDADPSGNALLFLEGIWHADDMTVAVASVCTEPLLKVENAVCTSDAAVAPMLFRIVGKTAKVLDISGSDAFRGHLVAVSPTLPNSPEAYVLIRDGEVMNRVQLDWRAGDPSGISTVDSAITGLAGQCVTGSGTVVAAGSGNDEIDLAVQSTGGVVSSTTISWDAGWFQELRCGTESAYVVTPFGAVYRVGDDASVETSVPAAPLPDRQTAGSSGAITGPTADDFWLVAGPRESQVALMARPNGLGWAPSTLFMDELHGPGMYASANGTSLLSWGRADVDSRLFYSVDQSE